MNAYTIPCYACDGRGQVEGNDGEGNRTVDNCRWCYRGRITIRLKPEDERKLLEELQRRIRA